MNTDILCPDCDETWEECCCNQEEDEIAYYECMCCGSTQLDPGLPYLICDRCSGPLDEVYF